MLGKKTIPLLVLAMGMFLGSACGPDQEEYEFPARPGESPSGYEQPPGQERPLMQPEAPSGVPPEATPEAPMGEPGTNRDFQSNDRNQGQGALFDARPTQ